MHGRWLFVMAVLLAASGSVRLAAGEQAVPATQVVAVGFFVTADGYFVSAGTGDFAGRQLVVEDADGVRIAARLQAVDPLDGLLLLKARGRFPTLVVANGAPLAPGTVVRFADGRAAPSGDELPAATIVGGDGVHWQLSDVPADGLPGTPLLGADGEVVGVLRAAPAANGGDAVPAAVRAERLSVFLAAELAVRTGLHTASRGVEGEEPPANLSGAVARLSVAGPSDAALAEVDDASSWFAASLHRLARQAAGRNRLREAEHWWRLAAQRGSRDAQTALAVALLDGPRASAAQAEGMLWLRTAAVGGHAGAQAQLGAWYAADGREPVQARRWLEQAAQGGLPEGQRRLGNYLIEYAVVPDDFVLAVDWLQRAAAQGDVPAQQALVEIFRKGRGPIKADPAEAAWWQGQIAEGAERMP